MKPGCIGFVVILRKIWIFMMNKFFVFSVFLAAIVGGCAADHGHEGEAAAVAGAGDEHSHEGVVVLPAEMAERFGVRVDSVVSGPMASVMKCAAQVERAPGSEGVVAAPVAGLVKFVARPGDRVSAGGQIAVISADAVSGGNANQAAKASLEAARREVERLKPLYDERLVTAAEYQAAVAALEVARASYSPVAASGRACAPVGGTVTSLLTSDGAFVNVGEPLARVDSDSRLILRANVPSERYAALRSVSDARIRLADGRLVLLSELGGKPGGVTASGGFATSIFSFDNNGSIAPGTTVEAWLIGESGAPVVSLPKGALVEQQGMFFVYREVMANHYEKVAVTPGESDGQNVRIVSGVEEGDRIVTSGATTVRLAESSGSVPEGHSHNH